MSADYVSPLSLLERTNKALLIALTSDLQTRDVANAAATSTTMHAKLQEEVANRRLVDKFSAYWHAQAGPTCDEIAIYLGPGWSRTALVMVPDKLLRLGLYDQAASATRAALELASEGFAIDAGDHSQLVNALLQAGKAPEAITAAREALTLFPDDGRFHVGLVKAYLLLDQLEDACDAMQAYDRTTAANSIDPRIELVRAMLLHSCGDEQAVRAVIDEIAGQVSLVLSHTFQSPTGYCIPEIAEAYAWIGDVDSALQWMETSLQTHTAKTPLPLSPFAEKLLGHRVWRMLRTAAEQYLVKVEVPPLPPLTPPPPL